jgi:phenylpropionate dioxygenase-like ring-hydroxylating dioxygenase large terminal subunit
MTTSATLRGAVPFNAWYAVAPSPAVGRDLLGLRAMGTPVVLYRTTTGAAVALEDRCAHRPYPLSLGRLDGDRIVSGYTGFVYGPDGACLAVPTQAEVPIGARVRAFPTHDDGAFVWAWFGTPELAALRPPPRADWLTASDWVTFGEDRQSEAALVVLQDNFADITHVAVVDEVIAPPVLSTSPPPVDVEVSETSVSFARTFPPAVLAPWHARAIGVAPTEQLAQREEGQFVSPGLWVDAWHVSVPGEDAPRTFRFTHALTPVDARTTHHSWRVSRNFASDDETTAALQPLFASYYATVQRILETVQAVVDTDGPRPDVNVVSDAAGSAVRRIMRRMVADEGGSR